MIFQCEFMMTDYKDSWFDKDRIIQQFAYYRLIEVCSYKKIHILTTTTNDLMTSYQRKFSKKNLNIL